MNILLTTLNTKYIHKNQALRWLYVTCPVTYNCTIQEYTINDNLQDVIHAMHAEQYDVIGISVYIWNAELTKQWILLLKEQYPTIRIILGGPEVTYENDDWFTYPIEAIVQGEGEKTFWDYLQEKKPSSVKTHALEDCDYGHTDIAWLEQFHSPYFLPFDLPDITHRYLYLETSRGCPYGCAYCLSERDRQVRYFSKPYLSFIFEQLKQYKIRQVKFLDRTFNLDPERALWTLHQLEEIHTVESFQMELVAETLPEQLLSYMETTMDHTRFRFEAGVQSFHPATLQAVGRKSDLNRLSTVITRLVASGVVIHADLIAGLPYEDLNTFAITFNHLLALSPTEIQLGTLKLLKGTSLRAKATQYQLYAKPIAPYEVQTTAWLSEQDLNVLHEVSFATEKAYNNNRLRYTLKELFRLPQLTPFALLQKIGNATMKLPHPYQPRDYFLAVYERLRSDYSPEMLMGLLLADYYRNTRQKPAKLFIEGQDETVMAYLKAKNQFKEHMLEHYAVITPLWSGHREMHQMVVYRKDHQPCTRYQIDMQTDRIEELK